MIIYELSTTGILESSYEFNKRDPLPDHYTFITPPAIPEGKYAQWTGGNWLILDERPTPLPVEIPQSVTKRQGRQQMILMGLLSNVQAAIDTIEDETERLLAQSFWDDSTQYERTHPQMIQLAQAMGLTDEQLDQAFIAASKL